MTKVFFCTKLKLMRRKLWPMLFNKFGFEAAYHIIINVKIIFYATKHGEFQVKPFGKYVIVFIPFKLMYLGIRLTNIYNLKNEK